MFKFHTVFGLCALALVQAERSLIIWNKCSFFHHIAFVNNAFPEFVIPSYENRTIKLPDQWSGGVYAKTHCDPNCETGVGDLPKGVVELNLTATGLDHYGVNLLNGHNVPFSVYPVPDTFSRTSADQHDCGVAGCVTDQNYNCPSGMSQKNKWGEGIACYSVCQRLKTDQIQACCPGHQTSHQAGSSISSSGGTQCDVSQWEINYPVIYRRSCPEAFHFEFQRAEKTFSCQGKPHTSYVIKMCPNN